jgi:hypothetical protein
MFQPRRTNTGNFRSAVNFFELVYHSVVRSVRKQHNNAFAAIGINILQAVIFVGVFYVMFSVLGMRGAAIRGDFVIYIMTGIFLFMVHTKTVAAVAAAEGPASAMMKHAPMTTMIALAAAALGALYIQMLSLILIMSVYHLAFNPVVIYDPSGVMFMLVYGRGRGDGAASDQTLGTGFYTDIHDDLPAGEYDRFGQDVSGQFTAVLHAGHVRLEPLVPRHRPGARICVYQLQPALQ